MEIHKHNYLKSMLHKHTHTHKDPERKACVFSLEASKLNWEMFSKLIVGRSEITTTIEWILMKICVAS